ncbi:MAG: DMT family transporter [Pseudomonadota bacterium]
MMLLAWFFFALVDTSAKWLVLAGLPALQLAFMRYAVHFAISIALVSRRGGLRSHLETSYPWTLLSRAFLLVSATIGNFFALYHLPLTVISAIMFSSPIIVCFLSITVLKEQIGPWRWGAILLGFLGVMVVIRPFGETFHPAMIIPVYNAAALALYSLMTRRLAGIVSVDTQQLYLGGLGTFALLLPALWVWQAPASALDVVLLFGLGVGGWAGHQLLTNAHRFAPAHTLMPYTYSFIIYTTILSLLVFDELPDVWVFAGAGIIIVSGLIIWNREHRA